MGDHEDSAPCLPWVRYVGLVADETNTGSNYRSMNELAADGLEFRREVERRAAPMFVPTPNLPRLK